MIFWIVRELKEQKVATNDKKLCLSGSISLEPYTMWSSFMVHMCKVIIHKGIFFVSSKCWFFGLLGEYKTATNDPKFSVPVRHTLYLKNCRSFHQENRCKIIVFPGVFLFFKKKYIYNIVNIIIFFFAGQLVQFFNK